MILAVDPGIGGCGVALAVPGRLVRAGYVKSPRKKAGDPCSDAVLAARAVWRWVWNERETIARALVEWPRVYPAGKAKRGADPNDLLLLAGVDAAIAVLLDCPVESIYPRDWKGTLDPDIVCDRIRDELLTPEERARVELPSAKSLHHNVYDACGIALHALNRGPVNGRTRVFPR